MAAKYYVNAQGDYLGAFDGAPAPTGAIEVPGAPDHAAQRWDGAKWSAAPVQQKNEADALRAALIRKGVLTVGEIDAEKTR